jgi:cytochrome c2
MQRLIRSRRADAASTAWARGVSVGLVATAMLAGPLASTAYADIAAWAVPGGDAQRGAKQIQALGCAGCHEVPGVKGAHGNVGPPLTRFGDRTFIAGMLSNTPSNLVKWIREPQTVVPGNAMPNMGISDADARDIAAYLYTLR